MAKASETFLGVKTLYTILPGYFPAILIAAEAGKTLLIKFCFPLEFLGDNLPFLPAEENDVTADVMTSYNINRRHCSTLFYFSPQYGLLIYQNMFALVSGTSEVEHDMFYYIVHPLVRPNMLANYPSNVVCNALF